MNRDRYEELLGILLDGALSPEQAGELAAGLQSEAGLRRDLQEHLVLWELWSQTVAPERSAEAFLAAWKTRLRAESETAGAFGGRVLARVAAAEVQPRLLGGLRDAIDRAAHWLRRPLGIAWTTALAGVTVAAIGWLVLTRAARATVVIHGEAVCTACTLHEGRAHHPAIRVTEHGVARTYYLDPNPAVDALQDAFCNGPVPADAEGTERAEGGRLRFSARRVSFPAPAHPPASDESDHRTLFPI